MKHLIATLIAAALAMLPLQTASAQQYDSNAQALAAVINGYAFACDEDYGEGVVLDGNEIYEVPLADQNGVVQSETAFIVFASMRCDAGGGGGLYCGALGCSFDIIADSRVHDPMSILPHAPDMVVRLEDGGYPFRIYTEECQDAHYTKDDTKCFREARRSFW